VVDQRRLHPAVREMDGVAEERPHRASISR
jgi:hypothetical protein